jgi:anhydro-N-acetylmuramic acid kinase
MSGTSADGIDVAIVDIRPTATAVAKLEVIHHTAIPYSRALRVAVLAAMSTGKITTPALAQLHWRLGIAYAEAVQVALDESSARIDLAGCHGQTIYHQGSRASYLGRSFGCTWQIGEPALVAAHLGVPVVANFRPGDMVHGGQGAPLVPLLDYTLFRHRKRARVLQNIGGIGNLTVIPAAASMTDLRAFDTGPGNMVIDFFMQQLYGRSYDKGGRVARSGKILTPVITAALRDPFFRKPPPKSAGREQFGSAYAASLLKQCKRLSHGAEDAVATATALTADSIAMACREYVLASIRGAPIDYLVSGGGAKNSTLMEMLGERLTPLGCTLATTGASSLAVEAKEAAAFALLAYHTYHRRPSNIPSATGAEQPAILGQVCYA